MSAFGSSRTKEPPCSLQVGRRGSAEEKGTEGIRSGGQRAAGRLGKLLESSRQKARPGRGGGGCDNLAM